MRCSCFFFIFLPVHLELFPDSLRVFAVCSGSCKHHLPSPRLFCHEVTGSHDHGVSEDCLVRRFTCFCNFIAIRGAAESSANRFDGSHICTDVCFLDDIHFV